jgi:hypothetical protein
MQLFCMNLVVSSQFAIQQQSFSDPKIYNGRIVRHATLTASSIPLNSSYSSWIILSWISISTISSNSQRKLE